MYSTYGAYFIHTGAKDLSEGGHDSSSFSGATGAIEQHMREFPTIGLQAFMHVHIPFPKQNKNVKLVCIYPSIVHTMHLRRSERSLW